jgi:hypothetical protein
VLRLRRPHFNSSCSNRAIAERTWAIRLLRIAFLCASCLIAQTKIIKPELGRSSASQFAQDPGKVAPIGKAALGGNDHERPLRIVQRFAHGS